MKVMRSRVDDTYKTYGKAADDVVCGMLDARDGVAPVSRDGNAKCLEDVDGVELTLQLQNASEVRAFT